MTEKNNNAGLVENGGIAPVSDGLSGKPESYGSIGYGSAEKPRRLLISFSGGETSAEMGRLILQRMKGLYDEIIIVFSNTSRERNECLDFVDQCDRQLFQPLGHSVIWIEAVQFHGQRKGAGFRQVTYETACRDGSVFEDMIRKYGIPNKKYLHCTRELKLNPITAYAESIGWSKGSYDTAVGIRADEIDRMSVNAESNRIIYPLIKWGVKKPDVNAAWRNRPFRLVGKGYQSNCTFCHKKTFRKHLTIISETPEVYEFPRRMEALYPHVGGEFVKAASGEQPLPFEGYRRVFFREGRSTDDLFRLFDEQKDIFTPAEDDSQIYPEPTLFDPLLDEGGGCGESCEVWADEMDEAA